MPNPKKRDTAPDPAPKAAEEDRIAALEARLSARDEEITQSRQQLSEMRDQFTHLRGGFDVLAAERARGNVSDDTEAPLVDVSDEEWETAEESGDPKTMRKLRKRQKEIDDERTRRLVQNAVAPVIQQVNGVGVTALAGLADDIASLKRDPKGNSLMPYRERFKKEIDDVIAGLDPSLRMQPANIKRAHDYVVSQHLAEIVEEETEKKIRELGGDPKTLPGSRSRQAGVVDREDDAPEPSELGFSPADIREIEKRGGKELFARKQGFDSWKEYATEVVGNQ